MKKILAFSGSPRAKSNSGILLEQFLDGASTKNADIIVRDINKLNIKPCSGCLRCNLVKRCTLRNDDWEMIKNEIAEADILVFAIPVYFHHLPGPLKTLIDRFRSFVHVAINDTGLIHTPHNKWEKDFVLLLTMGSPDNSEADPIIDLFNFICETNGDGNKLHSIAATRIAVSGHISKSEEEIKDLYKKMNINPDLAKADFKNNQDWLQESFDLGKRLSL